MPELAEVEVVARQIRDHLLRAEITHVKIVVPNVVRQPSPDEFCLRQKGQQLEQVGRRGKLLLIHLTGAQVLVIHRRMSGNLRLLLSDQPDEAYPCVYWYFADGRRLEYSDPRKFGTMRLLDEVELPIHLASFGPEPLEPEFTIVRLGAILRNRNCSIKSLLLDQQAIAGIGNIYADEALFEARIHPLRLANTLVEDEVVRLHEGIQQALLKGIEHGGTTFGRHQGLFGEAGTNLDHIKAYKRSGQPCMRCGTLLQRMVVAQRGTHFCPHCQPHPFDVRSDM
jgi:formamidopyrimidine-DNA glycosylase